MLENSQMRENMLLQYADDIIKVEIGSLRGEMLRFGHTSTPPNRKSQTSGWRRPRPSRQLNVSNMCECA